jgi:hypothetical protein
MNTDYFSKFKDFVLSPQEAAQIRGGNDLIKRAVIRLLIDKARQELDKPYYSHESLESLSDPLEDWKHRHFRSFSCLLDIPLNTVKYFMKEGKHFHLQTRQKILDFMSYEEWEDLEREALLNALSDLNKSMGK